VAGILTSLQLVTMSQQLEHLSEALAGRYELLRELGRGGMATVYLARDVRHDREVALKVLRPELSAILGRDRFLAEIRLTAKLNHPGLLTLLDSGEAQGALYYVLPYIAGGSLRDRLTRERQLPIPEAIEIGCQLAVALDHAHDQGIIHRDIKPENILLRESGPVLTDFGIALAVREAGGERLTETGLVVGTPQYMSPEQATGDRILDRRSDLYSLGAVVYEMLSGEPPVYGTTAQAIIARLVTERPTPLRVVRDTVSDELSRVVERSLAKVPADRFASGADFAAHLSAPAALRRRRIPTAWLYRAAGVAVAVGVLAWAGIVIAKHRSRPAPSASLIAVLPPTLSSPDSGLARLGRDLAFTLAPSLAGAGELRAVDPEAVRVRLGDRVGTRSREDDLALARGFGAGRVVRGSLVRVGDKVRWDVALLAGVQGREEGRVTVTARAESLAVFTDSATRGLLRQIWLEEQPPTPSLDAAVKTRSVPALKAFLSGEAAMLHGRWEEAAQAYNQAVAQDSSFWLAYWRLWFTSTEGVEVEPQLLDVARAHRTELPERERLVLDACTCTGESLHVAVRLANEAATRFPDDWFAQGFYAGYLLNDGPVLGYTAADARAAMERALKLRPDLVDTWAGMLLVSLGKDSLWTRRAVAALDSLGWISRQSEAQGHDVRLWYRILSLADRAPYRLPEAQLDSLVTQSVPARSGLGASAYGWLRFGYPGLQLEFDRRILARSLDTESRIAYLRSQAMAWAMRGAWDSALAADAQVADSTGAERELRNRYVGSTFAVWLGAAQPQVAVPAAQAAHHAVDGLPTDAHAADERALLTWLDGLLAVARRDRPALATAVAAVHRSRAPVAHYMERSLRALGYRLDGNARREADSLVAADRGVAWDQSEPGFFTWVLSVNRLAGARAFLQVGDTAQAVKLLVWHEAELNGDNLTPQIFAPFAYLQLARIEQAQGRIVAAREHYGQFLRRYDPPTGPFRPLVDEARRALSQLSTQS
jgi:hypothetical protein